MLFGSKESKIEKCIAKKNAGPVIKMVYDKDDKVAMQAIEALGKIGGDDGYNVLIALIRDKNAKVRAAAVTALGELGESYTLKEVKSKVNQIVRAIAPSVES